MFWINFKRVLKAGAINFWRNGTVNIATTSIMTVTLLSISILLILNFLGQKTVENFKDKIDISVYFNSDVSKESIFKVRDELAAMPEVKSLSYLSKDEAWERFKAKHLSNPVISQGIAELDVNPLYATLNIKAKNIDDYPKISDFLSRGKYAELINKINFEQNKQGIEKLSSIVNAIQKGGLWISLIFAIISVFVIFNAIRLTMYGYRQEVEIMRLVGAGNWYIRLPFIVEGALYGIIGSIVSIVILALFVYFGADIINRFLIGATITSYFKQNALFIFGVELLLGIAIGVLSSLFAIRKYLKA